MASRVSCEAAPNRPTDAPPQQQTQKKPSDRQILRASNVVTGLIFKGINNYCKRDVEQYEKCRSFYSGKLSNPDEPLPVGVCGREKEMAGTCRLIVADNISTRCIHDIGALTYSIANKAPESEITSLTEELYRCGMTETPGLTQGSQMDLPGSLRRHIYHQMIQRKKDAEFKHELEEQVKELRVWEEAEKKRKMRPDTEEEVDK